MSAKQIACVVLLAVISSVLVVVNVLESDAQLYDPPAIRYQTNARGEIESIGNTVMTCPASAACTAAQAGTSNAANNQFSMIYVDIDSDGSTFNSSSADLSLPPGATVQFAGLYWGGDSNSSSRGQVRFRPPGAAGYSTVNAAVVDSDGGPFYQGFYDATADVAAAGSGTYTVANVQARTGSNRYGGWSLVVVFRDASLPFRNLTVYDGFARVNQANPVQIVVSGFLTPVSGPVAAKVTNIVYEGDQFYSGDQMQFEGVPLSDGSHPANNFFNSRISRDGILITAKNPNYVDQLGFDIARVDVTGLLNNNQTSATVDYTSQGDNYYVGVVATSIDIFAPDLSSSLTKSYSDLNGGQVVVGDIIEYSIDTTNIGEDPAVNSMLVDAVPAGTAYVPGSLRIVTHPNPALNATSPDDDMANIATDGGGFDGAARFDLGTIDVDEQFVVRFRVQVQPGAEFSTIENLAVLDYQGATTGDSYQATGTTSFTVAASTDLVLDSKTEDNDPVIAGQALTYTIDVSNDGPSPAVNPVITDVLPTGMTFLSGAGCSASGQTVTCALASPLGSGASASVDITVQVAASAPATTVTNNASIMSDTADTDASNNAVAETTEIIRRTDVTISKSAAPATVLAGNDVTYTLTVTNAGPSTATGTVVNDVLPPDVTLVSAVPSNGTSCSGTALLVCSLGTLAATEVVTITVVATVDPDEPAAAVLTNSTSVSTTTTEFTTANNSATADTDVDRAVDLAITKTGPATVNAGAIVSYGVTVSNDGPSSALNTVITDVLPSPLVFDAATSSPSCTLAPPDVVTCALGTIAPGPAGDRSVTISARVPSSTTPRPLTNTATVTADEDPVGASDDHALSITRQVSLNISKTDDAEPIPAGATLTYTINVGNDGPSDASSVSITDDLPPEVNVVSAAFSPVADGSCAGTTTVVCTPTGGLLAAGATATVTIEVSVPPDLPDGTTISNSATITAAEDPTGATAVETTNSVNAVDLSIGKIVTPNPVLAGNNVTYTVTLVNEGPSNAVNPLLVDTLPAEASFVSAVFQPASDGVCVHDGAPSGGVVTCTPATLDVDETVIVRIVAKVAASTPDSTLVVNSVRGSAFGAADVTGTAQVNVQRQANLSVVKTASPDPVTAGQSLTYTITIDNLGPSDASGVVAFDPLPAGVTMGALPPGCSNASGTVTCAIGALAAGATSNVDLTVDIDPSVQPGTDLLANTVSVSSNEPDPDPSNNSSTVSVDVASAVGLSISKSANANPVIAGQPVIYTLDVSNTGPSDADNVVVSDPIPAALIFDGAASTTGCTQVGSDIRCPIGLLEPGQTTSVNIAFTVDSSAGPQTFTNTATVASDEDPTGASASTDTTIETRADIAIVKTSSRTSVDAGRSITYSLRISNAGPSDAVNTVVTDVLPPDFALDSLFPPECSHDGSPTGGTVTCVFDVYPADDIVFITIDGDVVSTATGTLDNTATIASDTTDPSLDNNESSTSTPITPVADLDVTKTASADPVTAGGSLDYAITIENLGPSTAANVVAVDTLPDDLSFTGATGAPCVHDGAPFGGVLTCTIPAMAPDDFITIDVSTTVDPATVSTVLSNRVDVTTDTFDDDAFNNTATETTGIEALAGLTLSKAVTPDPVIAGQQLTYTITLSNAGPSAAQSVNVNDDLPLGVRYVSATPISGSATCVHDGATSGGELACGYGTVGVGETIQLEVVVDVLPDATGTLVNNAVASSPTDPNSPSASASATVQGSADLVLVDKTDNVDPAVAGQGLVWSIAVRNDGPSDAVNAVITDVLPAGVTYDDANSTPACADVAGTITCPVGTLSPGGTASVDIAVVVDPARDTPVSNTASTSSDTADPDGSNNSQSETTTIERQSQVLVSKTASPRPVIAGEQLVYTVTVENLGPSSATITEFTDPLPPGTTFVSALSSVGACANVAGTVECPLGTLAVNDIVTVTITVDTAQSLAAGTTIANTATVDWAEGGPSNGPSSVGVQRRADLAITKTDVVDLVAAGTDIVYDISITNNGPSDATDIVVTDTLPPDTTFNAAASSPGCSAAGSTVTCTVASLVVGPPAQFMIAATVDSLVPPGTVLNNTAAVAAAEPDPVAANNTDDEDTTISRINDLSIVKTDDPEPVVAGEQITWILRVNNAGPSNAASITIQDQLPPGVTFAGGEITCSDVPAGQPGALVTCTIPAIAAGDDIDVLIVGDVDPALVEGDSILNAAEITAFDGTDPNLANNTDDEPTTIDRNAGLMVSKSASPAQVVAGEQLTFTITVTNDGPSFASGVTLVDVLPSEVSFDSVNVLSGTADCSEASGTVSCDVGTGPGFDLAPGASAQIEIVTTTQASLGAGASIANTATADSPDSPEPATGQSTTPIAREADLELAKTATPSTAAAGETVEYTLVVTNNGPSDATAVEVTDMLPTGMTWSSGDCTAVGVSIECSAATVAAGSSATFIFDVAIDPTAAEGAVLTNNALVTADEPDPVPGNNTASTDTDVVRRANVSVTKTDGGATVTAGLSVVYSIDVTNQGPSQATAVEITDAVPAGTTYDPGGSTPGCSLVTGVVTCPVSPLDPNSSATVLLAFVVDDDRASGTSISNTVDVTAAEADPDSANNSATDDTPVITSADVRIAKSAVEASAVAGATLNWVVSITNDGPSQARSVAVSDLLPAGLTGVAVTPAGCDTSVSCSFATLDVGQTIDIEIESLVDAGVRTDVVNSASVNSTTPDPQPANNNSGDVTVPIALVSDLTLDKTGSPSPVVPGGALTYTIVVTNEGPSDVIGAVVTDTTPPELLGPASSCSVDPAEGTCTDTTVLPETSWTLDLVAGASATITITGTVDPAATADFVNSATVTVPSGATDPAPSNNTDDHLADVTVTTDLTIVKSSAPDPVVAGEAITYTLTVTNQGPSVAVDAAVADTLPAELIGAVETCIVDPVDGACAVSLVGRDLAATISLEPGASLVITVDGTLDPSAGSVVNTATVAPGANATDPDPSDNSSTDSITAAVSSDVSVSKSTLATGVTAGETVTWSVEVANAGPSTATGVVVTDTPPPGSTIVDEPAGCSGGACSVGTLLPGETVTLDFEVLVDASVTGTVLNTVDVSSTSPDPDPDNNSASSSLPVLVETDLSVIKMVSPGPVVPGEPVTYTIVVANAGPSRAVGAAVADVLAAALILPSASCVVDPAEGSCSAPIVAGELAGSVTLDPGASATFTIDAVVDPSATGDLDNTATVTAPSGVVDPDGSNNSDAADVVLVPSADVSVTKSTLAADAVAGETIVWTVQVTNNGPSTAAGVVMTDTVPAGLTLVDEPAGCSGGVCAIGTMLPGALATFDFDTAVDPALTGSVTNTADVSAATADPDSSNNSASVPLSVVVSTDLGVTKTSSPDPIVAGSAVTYTVTITNDGPSDAVGAVLNDLVPAQVLGAAATCNTTPPGGSCSIDQTGNDVTATLDIPALEAAVIVIAGTVDPAFSGSLENTASVVAGPGADDPSPANNTDTNINPATSVTDLSVTKVSAPNPAVAGEPITYTITVTNGGPSRVVGAAVIDLLPASLVGPVAGCAVDPAVGTCAATVTAGELNGSVTLDPAGSATFTVDATVDPSATAAITNTATVSTPPGVTDPDSANDTSVDTNQPTVSADVAVSKSILATEATAGETLVWTVQVTNNGPSTATGVVLTDTLPAGLTLVDEPAGCSGGVCAIGTMAPGVLATFDFEVLVDAAVTGSVTNTADILADSPDPEPANDTAASTLPVVVATDLAVTKTSAPAPLVGGGPITYTITVTNNGPSDAVGAALTDAVPVAVLGVAASCTGVPAGGSCTASTVGNDVSAMFDIPDGAAAVITITGVVDPGFDGLLSNTATVVAGPGALDPDSSDNTATDSNSSSGLADLSVIKMVSPGPIVPGEAITYTIVVANGGPSQVVDASVSDVLAAALLSPNASCVVDPAEGACSAAVVAGELAGSVTLDPGASATFTIDAVVDPSATGDLDNTATVTPPPGVADPDGSNNSDAADVVLVPAADVSVSKSSPATEAVAGETVLWTVVVSNAGPSTAAGVSVADTLPPNVTIVDEPAACSGGICAVGTMLPGATVTLSFETLLDSAATGSVTNTAAATSDTNDADATNNTGDATLPVVVSTDLAVAKTSAPDPAVAGEAITYFVTVTNNGPSDAVGADLTDTVPAAILGVSASCGAAPSGGNCAATTTGSNVSAVLDLPAGTAVTILITGTVDAASTTSIENTAVVDAGPGATDPSPSNNSDTNINPATAESDLSVTKTSAPNPAVAGEMLTYTMVVSNDGPSRVTGASLIDLLPAALVDPVATCTATAPAATCGVTIAAREVSGIVTLEPGASATFTVVGDVNPSATSELVNTATVSTPPGVLDPDPSDDTASDTNQPTASADLFVSKSTSSSTAVAGENVTWTVQVGNNGPSTSTGVVLTDLVPPGATIVDEPPSCTAGTCAVGTLLPGAVATLSFETVVDAASTGTLVNTVEVAAETADPDLANNTADSALPIVVSTDLAIVKSSSPDPVVAGTPVTYTVRVTNNGPSDAVAATVLDNVPVAVLDVGAACATQGLGTCAVVVDGNDVSATTDLAVGASATMTISGVIDPARRGEIVNIASVEAGPGAVDPSTANNTATATSRSTGQADLVVTKTATPKPAVPGEPISYRITVRNNGPSVVTGAALVDLLPVQIVAPSASCAVAPGDGSCSISVSGRQVTGALTLQVGAVAEITIAGTVSVAAVGALSNTATVTLPAGVSDPNPANNSATDTTSLEPSADVRVTKAAPTGPAVAGETVTWLVQVRNDGPSLATGVVLTELLPAGVFIVDEPAICSAGVCGVGTLAPGKLLNLEFETLLAPSLTGSIVNIAQVSAQTPDADLSNNSATTNPLLVVGSTDLRVDKTSSPQTVIAGQAVSYTITVANNGPSDAFGATLADTLPAALLSPTAGCTIAPPGGGCAATLTGSDLSATLDIPVGESATLVVNGTIDPAFTGTVENTVTVAAGPGASDPSPTNNTDTSTNPSNGQADLAITKTSSPNPAVPGEALTYTMVVTNPGPSVASGAVLIDLLSAEILSPSATCSIAPADGTCTVGITARELVGDLVLNVGATATITVAGTIDPDARGGIDNTATIEVPDNMSDPNPANNIATEATLLEPAADLYVNKSASVASVVAGTTLTWTVTVGNSGPSAAKAVALQDLLPDGLSFVSEPAECTAGLCTIGTLEPGEEVVFDFETSVDGNAPAPLINTANVVSLTPDPTPANNTAVSPPVDIVRSSDLAVTKTSAPQPAVAGLAIRYTITVVNDGPSDTVGASLADLLPAPLLGPTAACVGVPLGSSCDVGIVDGEVVADLDLPVGRSLRIIVDALVDPTFEGVLANTAVVAVPGAAIDPDPSDNTAIDVNASVYETDLTIEKTVSDPEPDVGDVLTWLVVVTNNGPSAIVDATVADELPDGVADGEWVCVADDGVARCDDAAGEGDIATTIDLDVGASAEFTITARVWLDAADLTNTATVTLPPTVTDLNMADNSSVAPSTSQPVVFWPRPGTPDAPVDEGPIPESVPVVATVPETPPLSTTGTTTAPQLSLALIFLAIGGTLMVINRRRED